MVTLALACDVDQLYQKDYLKKLYKNVAVLDTGARGATVSFVDREIGDVNLFHGRIDGGWAKIGEANIHLPEQGLDQSSESALFFVRPHEIKVSRTNGNGIKGISAYVRDIRRYGAVVRLELERIDGDGFVEAVLSREEFKVNDVCKGDEVVLQPKRVKVFPQAEPLPMDYVI